MTVNEAAAEVIAAYREHEAFLLIGGHKPDRVNTAMLELENALRAARLTQESRIGK